MELNIKFGCKQRQRYSITRIPHFTTRCQEIVIRSCVRVHFHVRSLTRLFLLYMLLNQVNIYEDYTVSFLISLVESVSLIFDSKEHARCALDQMSSCRHTVSYTTSPCTDLD